jgi:hypothetical protein
VQNLWERDRETDSDIFGEMVIFNHQGQGKSKQNDRIKMLA